MCADAQQLELKDWTIPAMLRRRTEENPHGQFLQFEDTTLSFADVAYSVDRLATGFATLGVSKGDRVLIMMDNSLDLVVTWFAINRLGAIEVPVNTANRGRFLEHIINNSAGRWIVADECYVDVIEEVAGPLPSLDYLVVRRPHGNADLPARWRVEDFARLSKHEGILPDLTVTYRDIGAILYTSGTTGPAKGVLMPHAHMAMIAYQAVDMLRIKSTDVNMVCLPLFHAHAQFVQIQAALYAGCKAVIYPRFSATQWLNQIRHSGATVSSLLGVMAQFLWAQPSSPHDSHHNCRRLIAQPLPSAIAQVFERRFKVRCLEIYGMTEIAMPVSSSIDEDVRPGAAGKVRQDSYDVNIVHPETDEELPSGQEGEIVVRPKVPWTLMQGYSGMPEETVRAWRNLWFHTGDSGRFDDDGYLYFVDRIKDRIRRRGENISSYEVESVVNDFPDVTECAVVAVPAEEGDDDIKACVVTEPGVAFNPVTLLDHCREKMPYFAIPRYVQVMDELPKTPTGKIVKHELRRGGTAGAWDRESVGYVVKTNAGTVQQ
ncbi:MAG: AMP-binding protein [Pseudonocardiaceae bacterium]|nr:AMP-binding protein [Pseudonocardiaceae bacterium]